MAASDPKVIFRIPPSAKAWLSYSARVNNRSMNDEFLSLLGAAMAEDPLQVFIHAVEVFGLPSVFSVSIGEYGDELGEWTDKADAVAAARRQIKALGLPRDALKFNLVTDKG